MVKNPIGKEIRYRWEEIIGNPGVYRLLSKHKLRIDHSYQREELQSYKILRMAQEWEWALCHTLLVAERSKGEYYVVDGQQRRAAAMKRSDVDLLPCIVYQSPGPEWEARIFDLFGTSNTKLNPLERHRARLETKSGSKYETAAALEKVVTDRGYKFARTQGKLNIGFVGVMTQFFNSNPIATLHAFDWCATVAKPTNVKKDGFVILDDFFKGMFTLAVRGVQLNHDDLNKLRYVGWPEIKSAMNSYKIAEGAVGGQSQAKGILKIINRGRKTRRYDLPERSKPFEKAEGTRMMEQAAAKAGACY